MDFEGSWALVTGASSGLSEVFARELVTRRANVVVVAHSQDKPEALARELQSGFQVSVDVIACDLSVPAPGLGARLGEREVQVDVLVNNAGFGLFGLLHEADPARIAQEVQLNVAALTATCAVLSGLRARDHGAIVNVASTAAFQPLPYMAVYGATKAYVLSFTEALWAETRGTAVRVTALCPGATDTAFFNTASDHASIGTRMAPEQVAAAAFRALERRRCSVVPGLTNRLQAGSTRLLPRRVWCGCPSARCAQEQPVTLATTPRAPSEEAPGLNARTRTREAARDDRR